MSDLKHVRAQGAEAKKHNDDNTDKDGNVIDTGKSLFSEHDCPYGPGANRDAWLAGFGAEGSETVKQVDTSTPTTDDVRKEPAETVKEPKKATGSKAKKEKAAKDATTVTTDTSGTAETALKTTVAPTNPELGDTVPTPETVIGDPAASTGPNDANVQHVDEASGDSVKPSDVM